MRKLVSPILVALCSSICAHAFAHESSGSKDDEARKLEEARRRSTLRTYHRSMGITTWISLAATVTLGTMRYANVIGFGEPLCNEGRSPILGRTWGCGDGLLYQHAISSSVTTLSYISARTLAGLMPDPFDAAAFSPRLRVHRALSWVHLLGMIAMPILGIATTQTHDPDIRKTLATTHLIVGYGTFAAVSAAGIVMTF